MASVDENLAKIQNSRFFSKLDANSGFWQIPLDPGSRLLTTFITPFGRYCFNRLPFGISSAPEVFQRTMSQILEGLDGVVCHMDDVLVHAPTEDLHDIRLHAVLQRLQDVGLTLNSKCEFSKTKMSFLGHIISGDGVQADPQKIKCILEFPTPENVTELQRFNGMVNQLAKFLPNLAVINEPLRQLLRKENQWLWDQPQEIAFKTLKEKLTSTEVLAHYSTNKPCIVASDASQHGIGAVLLQDDDQGNRRPISFASRSLTPAEENYAVIEKEALAATWACERFSDYVLGTKFTLETDHRPLVPLLSSTDLSKLPARILRFRLRIMRYSPIVKYVPGKNHYTADALSRAPIGKPTEDDLMLLEEVEIQNKEVLQSIPVTDHRLLEVKESQDQDAVCSQIKEYVQNGWPSVMPHLPILKPYWDNQQHLTINEGLLMFNTRIVIPQCLQLDILDKIHQGHLGITKCKGRAHSSVWWPGITVQVESMCRKCLPCSLNQNERKEPLLPTSTPDNVWERVGTDLFHFNKKDYIVVTDYSSRWLDFKELHSTVSRDVIIALSEIFATHGAPTVLISDNGPQYASEEFKLFAKDWGFTHVTTSPRHPQANGAAERAVQTAKNILKKNSNPYLGLLAYRTAPIHNGFAPSQLLMSRLLRTTLPTIPEILKPSTVDKELTGQKEEEYKERYSKDFDRRHRVVSLPCLSPGDKVYIRDQGRYGEVVQKLNSPRSYNVSTANGNILRRNRKALVHTGVMVGPKPSSPPSTNQPLPLRLHHNPSTSNSLPCPTSHPKPNILPNPNTQSASTSTQSTNFNTVPPSMTRSGRIVKPTTQPDMVYF